MKFFLKKNDEYKIQMPKDVTSSAIIIVFNIFQFIVRNTPEKINIFKKRNKKLFRGFIKLQYFKK